ncbi:MAG: hypothetical protein Q7R34_04295 [Dehalococcoidia bacterium]|nr:hypothetical protein [Dehalococcoidia bacterium]
MKSKDTFEEKRFTNQNWKRVLNAIYSYAPNGYGRGKPQSYTDDHPLAKRLKVKGYELGLIMAFLDDRGLIEYDNQEHNWINLTTKGFDVALQNQSAEKVEKFNKATLFLSLAIAIFAVTELLTGISDLYQKWFISGVIVLALVCGGLIARSRF